MFGSPIQDCFGLFSLGAGLSFPFAVEFRAAPQDIPTELSPSPVSDTAEHKSKSADRGEQMI